MSGEIKKKLYKILPYLILVLSVFMAYINVYNNAFLWDDEFLIVNNQFIRSFKHIPEIFTLPSGAGANRLDNFYRPMQILSYLIIYKAFGLNKFAFHFFNVFLHALNAILIYLILRKVFNQRIAFFTSLLWGVHPVNTEAVTYMSGTADPLSLFFILLSFFTYLKFKELTGGNKGKYLVLSLSFFVLALLSKESIIIFPALLLLYEIYQALKLNTSKVKAFVNTLLWFSVSIIYFIMRTTILNFGNTLNLYKTQNLYTQHLSFRIYTFLATLPHYLSFIFYPVNLHMERSFPVFVSLLSKEVFLPFIILILIFAYLFYKLSSKDYKNYTVYLIIAFGILWFFVSMFPFSGIIPVNAIILEHWLYLPSIGIFLLISLLLDFLFNSFNKFLVSSLVFISAVILISLTLTQNLVWRDPITFYNHILKYEEGTARVHNNLAMAYEEQGNLELAEKHYLKAISINDAYAQTRYNLATLYLRENRIKEAIENLNKSIEINPTFIYSYQLLSKIYGALGYESLSKEYLERAQKLNFYYG
ncbi:MAG: protein O-mannosyl-transferase [Candidatus Woesearchaeota archaeon]|nr:protein O-mannosyl-transferase [Candidatus Woesearchaeota archaeon]